MNKPPRENEFYFVIIDEFCFGKKNFCCDLVILIHSPQTYSFFKVIMFLYAAYKFNLKNSMSQKKGVSGHLFGFRIYIFYSGWSLNLSMCFVHKNIFKHHHETYFA